MVSTTSAQTADPIPDGNRFGIERRGIEHIPDGERRGTPRQLGMMWSGVVLNVGPVV
jgi:nucleobase:cation symporter-1, NCS1 family